MPSNNTNAKLVDSKTIAAIFGVDPRRVQQLAKEGIITATKEGHANRYDLLPTIQKYIKYLSDKANGRDAPKKDAEVESRRLEAEADLKRNKADMAALQLKELEGTMHRSEDVEAVMTDLVYSTTTSGPRSSATTSLWKCCRSAERGAGSQSGQMEASPASLPARA